MHTSILRGVRIEVDAPVTWGLEQLLFVLYDKAGRGYGG